MLEATCPFCYPKDGDSVILETSNARAICDARPVAIGHTLIVPKNHLPSALDLNPFDRAHLDILQQETAHRLKRAKAEVGIYEHGRSRLCRFHDNPVGFSHAHLHVLPLSFDFTLQAHFRSVFAIAPSVDDLQDTARYLYQEQGVRPIKQWAVGLGDVPRHFVRSEFQKSLAARGITWLPLDLTPDDFDDAVDATTAIFQAPTAKNQSLNLVYGLERRLGFLRILVDAGWQVIDLDLVFKFAKWWEGEAPSTVTFVPNLQDANRDELVVTLDQAGKPAIVHDGKNLSEPLKDLLTDDSPNQVAIGMERAVTLIQPSLERGPTILFSQHGIPLNQRLSSRRFFLDVTQSDSLDGPTWEDFRLNSSELTVEQIAEIVAESSKLSVTPGAG